MPDSEAENGPGLLPEPVRVRVLSLCAGAMGALPADQLPAPLRRVASFAPARRARVAATQIAAALESDVAFRERVATQVRLAVPEIAKALDEHGPPPAAHPVEVAAVAYLLRSDGWAELVEAARDAGQEGTQSVDHAGTVERLQRKLRDARAQLRSAQRKAKEQQAELKRDNTELRRKLADARRQAGSAEQAARDAAAAQEAAQKEAAGLEAEARRLRARVGDLEAEGSAARRSVREAREAGSLRARLLLETLLDSAQGLRRELALPPVSGAPADAVAGAVSQDSTASGTGMALSADDPALLEELLALPRVHVIVDGYNVTKAAWPTAPLDSQRSRLLNGLAPIVARSRAEVTVVFDGAEQQQRPPVGGPRSVRVMFSPPGVIADDVIRDLLSVEPGGRAVVVVSSDREVAVAAYRAGARSVQSAALVRLLGGS